jgi:hypothetical protein
VKTLTAIFTPANSEGYATAQATVTLTVAKATPAVAWSTPAPVPHGTPLGSDQLNAAASVPGRFSYAPAAGEVLAAGSHTLTATFTPTADDYATVQATVPLTVTRSTPTVTWRTPAPIVYGTALGAAQLNATASVQGKFVYIPGAGAVLAGGTHTPSVTFTPTDNVNYSAVQAAVTLTVTKATPVITWPAPASITYGTALSGAQLNATASIPGRFSYAPAAGEVLAAGSHTLTATFTPSDSTDYATVQTTMPLTVAKAEATKIKWPAPAPIVYGTALGSAQLNATAPVPGKFDYTPSAGEVLKAGAHTLSVTFTPTDVNFPSAQASVSLSVSRSTPAIDWPAPAPIAYGTALGATQLNATASIEGKFAYMPAAGEVLAAGSHTLSVTFTPVNSADATTAQATVPLTVTKATPIIRWPEPSAISYGTSLGTEQLNATALIPGTFVYTPAAGTVLASGRQKLSVIFTPKDAADYTTAQATVAIEVEGLANILSLIPATADEGSGLANQAEQSASLIGSASNELNTPETRTYKGATYVKGADGQWYLQKK